MNWIETVEFVIVIVSCLLFASHPAWILAFDFCMTHGNNRVPCNLKICSWRLRTVTKNLRCLITCLAVSILFVQETDFKEWKLVVLEILRFMKADSAFMNIRPLRYSLVLDPHPDSLSQISTSVAKRNLRLRDAILSSYHHNEVRY